MNANTLLTNILNCRTSAEAALIANGNATVVTAGDLAAAIFDEFARMKTLLQNAMDAKIASDQALYSKAMDMNMLENEVNRLITEAGNAQNQFDILTDEFATSNNALDYAVQVIAAEKNSLGTLNQALAGKLNAIATVLTTHNLDRTVVINEVSKIVGVVCQPLCVYYPSSRPLEDQIQWIQAEVGCDIYLAQSYHANCHELKIALARMGKTLVC